MRAEVWIRVIVCPAVTDRCQTGGLPAARRQVLLQHGHQHHVAFRGEVRDIPGDDSPAVRPGGCRNLSVAGRLRSAPHTCHRHHHEHSDEDYQADEDHGLLPSVTPGPSGRRRRLIPGAFLQATSVI